MKSLKILAAGVATLMMLAVSCTPDKKDKNVISLAEAEATFSASLTASDTTAMLAAGQAVMDSLQAGNIESALSVLYVRNEDGEGYRPLNDTEKEQLRARFSRFPVKSWTLDHYDMSIPSLNDLKYSYQFKEESNGPGMNLMFNPVKSDNGWILMLKQANQPAKDAANALDSRVPVRMPDNDK